MNEEQIEALWLVGELLGKERSKAHHSRKKERVEGLSFAIKNLRSELVIADAAGAASFMSGVESGTPDLTKTKDGAIISKGR